MDRTHHPPQPGGEPSPASNALAVVPASAAQTLLGLRVLLGEENRIPLDVEWIARQLFPSVPQEWSTDRVVRDVLLLEEAGHARTWAQNDREWLTLPPSGPGAHQPARNAPAPPEASRQRAPFSSAWEREKERERERAREDARERAWERVRAEDREQAARWEAEYSKPAPRSRPQRPARLDAPPLGCPDHPNGTMDECGPCGLATERRRDYFARHKYSEELALFEQQQWEGISDDLF